MAAVKLLVIDAIRNTVDVADPPCSAMRPSSSTAHTSCGLPALGLRRQRGELGLDRHVCRSSTSSARRRSSGTQSSGGLGRAHDELGEPGVDPAGDLLAQRRQTRPRSRGWCRSARARSRDRPSAAAASMTTLAATASSSVIRPASQPSRQPPGPHERLRCPAAEPDLERVLARPGVERRAVDLLAGPPVAHRRRGARRTRPCGRPTAGPGPRARPARRARRRTSAAAARPRARSSWASSRASTYGLRPGATRCVPSLRRGTRAAANASPTSGSTPPRWNDSGSHTESKPSSSRASSTLAEPIEGEGADGDADAHLHRGDDYQMVTVDDVRAFAMTLPRTTEALVRDRIKFRVGRIVYVAFSRDETLMGFGFPKDERDAARSPPSRTSSSCRRPADLRYQWVVARMDGARRRRDARARPRRVADVRPEEGQRPGRGA